MPRGILTSLITMGGLTFIVWRWMKRRSRLQGVGELLSMAKLNSREMNRLMTHALSLLRRRVRA